MAFSNVMLAPPGVTQGMENANALSQQALQNRQLELQNQYFPVTEQAKYLQGVGQYMRGAQYLNPANMLAKFQKDPSFQNLIANHPELANQENNIMSTAINGGAMGLGGMGVPGMPQQLTNPAPQGFLGLIANMLSNSGNSQNQNPMNNMQGMPNRNPVASPNIPQSQSLNNALAQQQPGQAIVVGRDNSAVLQPSVGQNSGIEDLTNDTANTQDVNRSEVVNKIIPKAVQLQRTYSQSFDNQIQPWISKIPDIANFAGLAGKANQHMDQFVESAGLQDSPQYNEWNAYVHVASKLFGNELRRSMGQNSSVAAQEEMDDLSKPATWNTDPTGSLVRANALMQAKKANDQVIFQSPGQISQAGKQAASQPAFQYATQAGTGKDLGSGIYQLITPSGKSKVIHESDIDETAKALKVSPDEVKKKLGIV